MKIFWTNSIAGVIISVGVAMGLVGSYHKEADGKPTQWALKEDNAPSKAVFEANRWADSVFSKMTLEEKIGQVFMIATYSDRNETYYRHVDNLIKNHHIGGLIFFKGGPSRQAKLVNRYQALSKVPLMVGIDGEWGLGMRLDSIDDFPKQMTLGAIQDNQYIYKMGRMIGRQCQLAGI